MTDVLEPQLESEKAMPTLRHGAIIARLGSYLDEHVRTSRLGLVCGPQTTFKVVGAPSTRYPDLAFVRRDRLPADLDVDADFAPDLAVEIVSGSDTFGDVAAKMRQYFASGVELVWIIDPLLRTVSAHTPHGHPVFYTQIEDLVGDPVLPGFRVSVRDLFDF